MAPASAAPETAFGLRWRWLAVTGALAITLLYASRLEFAPIYLHHDEVLNALNGYDIATSGRDLNGRFFPLYFFIGDRYWATPVVAYTMAIVLTMAPMNETTIRLVSVAVGLTSLALMYVVAVQIFRRASIALLATALLALTPAHFIHSRVAFDQIYPLPFVLGWLWCLGDYLESRRRRSLIMAGVLLGVGLYTYLGSLIMMPVYLALTWLALFKAGERLPRPYLLVLAAFGALASLLVPWHLTHPTQFGQQMSMYSVYDPASQSAFRGLGSLFSYTSLTDRSGVFHQGFSPSMLFFSGGSSLINGTSRTGVFLLPIAVLLPVGIYRILTSRMTPFTLVLLLGFASAPLAGAMVGEVTVNRLLVILPFAILLSAFGAEHLLESSALSRRLLGVGLLVLIPLQFAIFYVDYMGDYRIRSRAWFEHNIKGAVEAVIADDQRESVRSVYLSTQEIPFIDAFWRFFVLSFGRGDLLSRTVYFSAGEVDPQSIPAGALVLGQSEGRLKDTLLASGFREKAIIRDATGDAAFILFAR